MLSTPTVMTTVLASGFGPLLAERIHQASDGIAQRWLGRLQDLLPVERNDIFPSDQVLDHIPTLIREIADFVGIDAASPMANTAIQSKAHELGELRFAQQASVHQLLREYRLLGVVIAQFVDEQIADVCPHAPAGDVVRVLSRLNEAVFVLMEMTVDTFVGRYTDRIEEQARRLDDFNRMVSHELRQPLGNLQHAVELLASDAARADEQRRAFAGVGERNVRRLSTLIRMLESLARRDVDSPQLQTVPLDKVVDEALRQVREVAEAKGVELRNHVAAAEVTLDVSRFELVLVNLVSNAIKYRDPAKADPFVDITAGVEPDGVQVAVRDNGLGIRKADQPHVFQRFYRAHTHRDSELGNDGSGLGLAIVDECVKAMGGAIALDSSEGAGTTFVVTLPNGASVS